MAATSDGRAPDQGAQGRLYLRLLALAGLIGIPVSVAAFAFLALLHWLTAFVWEDLPDHWNLDPVPWWWPAPWLLLGGALVALAITKLPGHGGHVPIDGLSADLVPPSHLPGVLLAALGGLPLGVVLGPEAPLMAVGGAVAVILSSRWVARGPETGLLGASGSAAAVAVIFGSPLVAAVFILESVGRAGLRPTKVVLPCLLSAGVGALVFTGLGDWTGLAVASLRLPGLDPPERPDLADLLWTIPLALLIAFGVRQIHGLGRLLLPHATRRPALMAMTAVAVTAIAAAAYSLLTGRSPVEVLLSGQDELGVLTSGHDAPGVWALIALLALKGLAYAVSLATLRGGPIFPALFLGAAAGALLSGLPGFGIVPAMAAGMAAATAAILPLPVSAAVLITLLLGSGATGITPIVLIAVVIAFVTEQLIDRAGREPVPAE
ncbi:MULTISPECIES: chloride channel protein [Glycomyces]|uniref:Chloride channel protein n=2 Tax=Glycomyces TaxID=58113 RepID=A0A9X3PDZ3_9ACTN|nr:chloride channel protein [Glycomyces lechevalierae]MDA1383721.1 chloride channel protein [Glycomyces lechevalierae]MDR7341288.1 H+/Cl- antiporter ClcA [Glycomyces lechevalierae]